MEGQTGGAPAAGQQGGQGGTATNTSGGNPQGATGAGSATGEWYSSFNDDLKGYVSNKGFKDPAALADSYRNLEKLMGAGPDKLVKFPDKDDAPEWNDIWGKLGVPKEAKEYQLEVPAEMGDAGFADWAKEQFHKLKIPRKQGEGLVKAWNEYMTGKHNELKNNYDRTLSEQNVSLKKEWGAAFDQNVKVAKKAAIEFGLDETTLDKLETAMGYSKTMNLLYSLGSKIGEDNFVSANSQNSFSGALTPGQAKGRIEALKQDTDFVRRFSSGETSAIEEMTRLHKFAYPSE